MDQREPVDTAPPTGPDAGPDAGHDVGHDVAAASATAAATAPDAGGVAASDPVAAAVARLDELPHLELAGHPAVFQGIHSALQQALASIDDA